MRHQKSSVLAKGRSQTPRYHLCSPPVRHSRSSPARRSIRGSKPLAGFLPGSRERCGRIRTKTALRRRCGALPARNAGQAVRPTGRRTRRSGGRLRGDLRRRP
ncbi:MAG: hypothetical protein HSCHL_2056 [Hydrogenibacillus schlegelii]|uniref:Uncharacterized protein n=1 Tax=Hydrogenibacillus schlegelii TaxID=1484 RepID=A0A2T5GB92_HYDSH|nr:MAG: hypothetical protein HSCHL_2056 [Hydrogenibacillus schlegelii]